VPQVLLVGFLVKEILKEPVKEVILYDNFTRGKLENIEDSLKDPRCISFLMVEM
jgi:UDP-glucose 4-epimerase